MAASPIGPDSPTGAHDDSPELRRVAQDLSDHVARTEAWMRDALEGAKMLGWELDLTANRWTSTADLVEFYGLPKGADYTDPTFAAMAVHPDDVAAVLAHRQRAVETGEPMRYEFRGRVPAPDGSTRWFTTRGRALRDSAGKAVRLVAVTTDVTARKRAEEERAALGRQLVDAQKWESLGVLAGGVAHDFNNILTIILGSAGLARRCVPPGSPVVPHLEQIEQASRRAGDLCKQLLAYTGRGSNPVGTSDPNAIISESKALLGSQVPNATELRLDLGEGLPAVRAEPTQVRQALINLVINAAEAVGDSDGEVRVATDLVRVADETPVGYQLQPVPGQYVRLTVGDTGPGIPDDVRARMFDPFFTTKFAGRGLGLSAVLGILRSCGGAVRVRSAPGNTTVEVLWPAVREQTPTPAGSGAATTTSRAVGKALVIDDEMYVREVTASAVEELVYAALLAADGASALKLFREHAADVRLVVVDVVMPGMPGDQVLEELRIRNPDLPAVVISGFTDRRVIKAGPGTRTEFLQKPFHPEELIAVVTRLMG